MPREYLHGGKLGVGLGGSCAEGPSPFGISRRNGVREATELFWNATVHQHGLLPYAAMDATQTLHRVLSRFRNEGSTIWRRQLEGDECDILTQSTKRGFELARLFLTTTDISANPIIEEAYQQSRSHVVEAFALELSGMSLSQMGEAYRKLGLQPQRDGTFAGTSSLRRIGTMVH